MRKQNTTRQHRFSGKTTVPEQQNNNQMMTVMVYDAPPFPQYAVKNQGNDLWMNIFIRQHGSFCIGEWTPQYRVNTFFAL
ncbi:MAG TPA: hypothetical protein DIW24_02215, partial [Bacteroidetes bacterium]|nr:hypothetical protein [Bacteroidota bacterium]